MRARITRSLYLLLIVTLCALPLSAAPAADRADHAAAPSWTAQVVESLSGWLTALFPQAAPGAGADRVTAADGFAPLPDDPDGTALTCELCDDSPDGGGPGDGDNGGPDADPNG